MSKEIELIFAKIEKIENKIDEILNKLNTVEKPDEEPEKKLCEGTTENINDDGENVELIIKYKCGWVQYVKYCRPYKGVNPIGGARIIESSEEAQANAYKMNYKKHMLERHKDKTI